MNWNGTTATEQYVVRAFNSTEVSGASYYGDSETHISNGINPEYWDINGDADIPAFQTNIPFDAVPPDPPSNFIATSDASGDIFLSWTASASPDCVGTRLIFRTDRYPTKETEETFIANVPTLAAQSYKHTGLTNGVTYEYGAFSYDYANNFSGPANTKEVSIDTLPPSIESVSPASGETGVALDRNIIIPFNDVMSRETTENAFHLFPAAGTLTYSWNTQETQMTVHHGNFTVDTVYLCTVDSTASDDAGNPMGSDFTWWFRTLSGLPPIISNIKIDLIIKYPGDIISAQPRIGADITDPELGPAGISTIEVLIGSRVYRFSSPEIGAVFSGGKLNYKFPVPLATGTYILSVEAWDVAGNSTTESIADLKVMGGEDLIIGRIVNYPNPFDSDEGTTFGYTLSVDSDIEFIVYSIRGSLIYDVKVSAGTPGGIAGYNEVFWNGKSNGIGIGTGMYIIKVLVDGEPIESFKILVRNR